MGQEWQRERLDASAPPQTSKKWATRVRGRRCCPLTIEGSVSAQTSVEAITETRQLWQHRRFPEVRLWWMPLRGLSVV